MEDERRVEIHTKELEVNIVGVGNDLRNDYTPPEMWGFNCNGDYVRKF